MTSPSIPIIYHYTPSDRKKIPDYEVRSFFDTAAPGLKQVQIADVLQVTRQQIGVWMKDGMPAGKARELLAWRALEIHRMSAQIDKIRTDFDL